MRISGVRLRRLMIAAASVLAVLIMPLAFGQFVQRQVGGVFIGPDGVIENIEIEQQDKLRAEREKALQQVPAELAAKNELRKISLKRLSAAIAEKQQTGKPLDDEMQYLAGLQRIQYVFVMPEVNDLVLAGPGEGWKVGAQGEVVGVNSGRPVMLLDDLLVALRMIAGAEQAGISCSIDPTASGLQQLQNLVKQMKTMGDRNETISAIEKTLGPQDISVSGVPDTSHFARVMVAADYRMKRLAMNFDKSPVRGMPSFMELASAGGKGLDNMMPRWWMAPNYEALLMSPDGLAWELRGAGVKTVTEEDRLNDDGTRQHTGKAGSVAKKWADGMTAHFDELSIKDPIFGQLRNCMDLAIVAALIHKQQLADKAGLSLGVLYDAKQLPIEKYHAPKHVDSRASVLRKGRGWIISASGGVQVEPWEVLSQAKSHEALAETRSKISEPVEAADWWWN